MEGAAPVIGLSRETTRSACRNENAVGAFDLVVDTDVGFWSPRRSVQPRIDSVGERHGGERPHGNDAAAPLNENDSMTHAHICKAHLHYPASQPRKRPHAVVLKRARYANPFRHTVVSLYLCVHFFKFYFTCLNI